MTTRPAPALALILLSAASAAAETGPPATAAGLWLQTDQDGDPGAWFQFTERGGIYEGRIVRMFRAPDDPADPVCRKCTDDRKNQSVLGLAIVRDMRRHGLEYNGGNILDPRDGKVYNAQMALSADGRKLSVRGYLGLPLFGQTQVWVRLPDTALNELKDAPKRP